MLPNHEGSARPETDEQAHRLIASAPPSLDVCPCWRVYLKPWHDGKRLRRAGVWYHALREGKDGQRNRSDDWICSPLTVEAISVDARGEAFGRLLRFPDVLGRVREWIMPMPLLRGEGLELRGALLARGLLFEPMQRQRLVQYLMHQVPKRQILQVPTLGWHEGRFVLPDTVIGGGEIRFESEATQPLDYAQSGTLAQWREQGSGQTEDRQILESVRSFIERHGESRFAPRHATSAHPIRERAGYTEEDPATGQVTYLFLASGLREALSGQDLKRGLIALARAGWLVKGSGDKHRLQRKIQGKNTNVYAVSLPDDVLDDAEASQA